MTIVKENTKSKSSISSSKKREIIYVFQGGGALGSYQIGVYEALKEYNYSPDMVVGISIGAINAAIIAGNKPEDRLTKMCAFWDKISTKLPFPDFSEFGLSKIHHFYSAQLTLLFGQTGFFKPKLINPNFVMDATPDKISFYDTTPLRETLLELIDFEYLNQKHIRLCVGVVELESGDFQFFDSFEQEITVDHIMASGALPPGFPAIKINDKYYVDGGVYSNTPLSKIIDEFATSKSEISDVICFMVDLFSLSGVLPHSLDGILERIKDIRFSSHTKRASELYATTQNLSHAINYLASLLTPEQKKDPKIREIIKLGLANRIDIVHLIYHSKRGTELESKDYEFSLESIEKHRQMGYINTIEMLNSNEQKWSSSHHNGVTIYLNSADSEKTIN